MNTRSLRSRKKVRKNKNIYQFPMNTLRSSVEKNLRDFSIFVNVSCAWCSANLPMRLMHHQPCTINHAPCTVIAHVFDLDMEKVLERLYG